MIQIFKDKCYFPDSDSQAFIYSTHESLVLMQGWGGGRRWGKAHKPSFIKRFQVMSVGLLCRPHLEEQGRADAKAGEIKW